MSIKLILSSILSGTYFKIPESDDDLLFENFRNSYPYPDIENTPLKEILTVGSVLEYIRSLNRYNDPDQPQYVYISDSTTQELTSFNFSNPAEIMSLLSENNNFYDQNFRYEEIKSDLEELNAGYENLKNSVLNKDTHVDRHLPLLVKSGNAHVPFLVKSDASSPNSNLPFLLEDSESIQYTYSSSFDYCSIIDTSLHMDFIGKGALVELLLEGIPDPIYLDPRVEGIYKTSITKDVSLSINSDAQHKVNIIVKDYIIFSERKIIYSKFTSYTHETRN